LKIGELFTFLGIRKFIFITIMVFIFIFSFIIYLYAVDTFAIITDLLEKDLSFTGRTIYWAYLFDEIFNKPILGYGFGTYWMMGSEHIYKLFMAEGLVLRSAHSGYLDLALQLGFMGMIVFVFMIGAHFKRALALHNKIAI